MADVPHAIVASIRAGAGKLGKEEYFARFSQKPCMRNGRPMVVVAQRFHILVSPTYAERDS